MSNLATINFVIAPSIADETLHAHTRQVQCASSATKVTVFLPAAFATFVQPANAPQPCFTALKHPGEGPRAQAQQPREKKEM